AGEPTLEGGALATRLPDLPRHGAERSAGAAEARRHTTRQTDAASDQLDTACSRPARCMVRAAGPQDADHRSARAIVDVGRPGGGACHGNRLDQRRSRAPRPTSWSNSARERTAMRTRAK